jgi:hypothetical protein
MLHPNPADTVFSLPAGTAPRPPARAARLPASRLPLGFALGHSALRPAWSGRRARLSLSPLLRGR